MYNIVNLAADDDRPTTTAAIVDKTHSGTLHFIIIKCIYLYIPLRIRSTTTTHRPHSTTADSDCPACYFTLERVVYFVAYRFTTQLSILCTATIIPPPLLLLLLALSE